MMADWSGLLSQTSAQDLTGQWIGTYKAESAGTAAVKLHFYELDAEALSGLAHGAHHDLAAGAETVVGIYQTETGAIGTIEGTIAAGLLSASATQTTPGCPAVFPMTGTVKGDEFTWSFTGSDCLGPEDGTGTAHRIQ